MVRPSPPRIEWSPDGTRFVTRLPDNRIRLHAEDGRVLRSLGTALDARWDGERIVSIDNRTELRWHGPVGVDEQRKLGQVYGGEAAWFAPRARVVACVSSRELAVVTFAGERAWTLDPKRHALPDPDHLAVAIAFDGTRVAIGYTAESPRVTGRGFVVIDLVKDVALAREFVALDGLVDAPIAFAFDRAGRRFVTTHPEPFPALGVIDLQRDAARSERIRAHAGGARCVALDERGAIAAYAYARAPYATGGRLQFDFLAVDSCEVESTLAFDPDLPDVCALGFDPFSRWLACLASTGAIEIVPVP